MMIAYVLALTLPIAPGIRWVEPEAYTRRMEPAPIGATVPGPMIGPLRPLKDYGLQLDGNRWGLYLPPPAPGEMQAFCLRACNVAGCSDCVGGP